MLKRICCMLLAICLVVSGLSISVFADSVALQVIFNDQVVEFANPPNVKDGHTLAPLRELAERAGFTVEWKNPEIVISNSVGTEILFTVGQSRVVVNGVEKMCPRAPEIVEGVTFVPLRFLCESLGYRVVYNEQKRLITITQDINSDILTPQMKASKTYFPILLSKLMPMDQNYVIAPWSVKLLLATVSNGADGKTKEQILEALDAQDLESLNQDMHEAVLRYGEKQSSINMTNSFWLNGVYDFTRIYRFDRPFSTAISNVYRNSEFLIEGRDVKDQINGWTSMHTGGDVTNLVPDSDFLSAFVNTMAFRANWETPFDIRNTVKSNFVNRDGETVLVDFMQVECRQRYYEDDSMQIIELPYEGKQVSMFIVLPKDGKLGYSLDAAFDRMQEENVLISLPRFRAELNSDISGAVRTLVGDAPFTQGGGFSKMFTNEYFSMKLGQVRQKTAIWVNESGTEISSATYMQQRMDEVPSDVTVFDAKHPFVFLIRDNVSEEILFIGEYAYAG